MKNIDVALFPVKLIYPASKNHIPQQTMEPDKDMFERITQIVYCGMCPMGSRANENAYFITAVFFSKYYKSTKQ